ncbi:dystrophin-like isoform X14 [Macrobrachium nipponense]|uniref:dystrophin-like isoform X14 n=1 Tax=Macrobrachium nipponense TaxID=159736 RepID=UPI0030C81DE7
MSDQGRKPNLRDLTSRLGQIQQRVVTIGPVSPHSTPENTGEVRRYVKIDVIEGTNAEACDNVPEGSASTTYGVQESTENEDGDGATIKEFVHEVEFQHNTLLGKMQMLRDVLAKQLNQSQVQPSLNQAQKDSNLPPVEQTQSQLGAVRTPDLQDQSQSVQNMSQTDEREDIQKKTFAKWINSQLVKGQHAPVTDLFYDLRDGTRLLALLEVLTNKTFKREKGRMRVHHLNNVSRALAILEDNNVKLVNISNEHIVDGSAKLTLGLVWAIILHWQVQGVLKDVMSDLQQTNLEKTLLAWCRQTTKGYHGVDVQNFTTSWTDGLAFNALIHSHRPHLFDWTVLARKHPYARLENAFRVAHEHLSIERLLDPEDVNSQVPDKKSIMMYVMCLFQVLPHASFTMESLDLSVQSDSSFSVEASSDDVPMSTKKNRPLSNVSIGLGEYQHTLEEVLTWLLGAEDRLAAMPPIAESTDEVKDQFHDLEELMLELTSKQGGIGDVLGEGSRLLREGVMEEEEEEEVRVQMKLLNTRWEELRVKAMDRQSKLHEKLMALQQNQLDSLKRWLTETEDRIANMSQVGPTLEALEEQIAAHQSLQTDLEKEQSNINSLSNMVVVVDESSSDAAYSSLEDELNALGERWAHICKWTESRWNMLQNLSVYWKALDQGMVKMRQWMDEKETLLRQVESNPSTEQEHILQQASMLQVLQAELEVQQRCLGHLQEHSANVASHLPSDSDIQEKISVELETIQDRMDILVSIIEAQTQRLAASGIDITKVVIPGKDSTDVVSSSTTTISHEGGTVVTKIITTKVVTTETVEVEGSGVKRQKLEGGCQEDFSVALHQLGGWMDMIEEKTKPRPVEELSLEQLMQLVQQLESEMETQKEEYYKVVSLGQSAISETSTIGESSQESEKQVAGITTRWEALVEMLVEIRIRVTYLTQKKKISTDLSDLEMHYQEFLRWCDDMQTISENEPKSIKQHLEQCQSKLDAMKNREEELESIMKAAESLDGKWTQETHILIEEIKIIITKWKVLVQRLLERRETLTQKAEEVQSASVTPKALAVPPESLLKAIEASREWLCSLETAIASECVVAPLPQMQDVFEKFKDLSQKVDTEQGNMAYINDACNSVSKDSHPEVIESVSKLNNQWELTTSDLKSRIKTMEKLIERQKQYNDEVTGLKSWLAEVDIFLQAEEAALGDIETLEAQLEQSNALQDDIATLQNNFRNISTTGKQLLEEGNGELKTMVKSQLEELTARWDTVTEQARVQNKSLKEALAKSQKVHEDIDKLSTWLDDVEKRIPSSLTTDKEEELNSGIETFSQLRDEISKHSEDFRALNNIGDEMLQLDAAATHEELARQFTQLNGRWTEVVSQVDSKYKTLTTAAQQYEDFKKYCAEEKDWLDQLQAGLEKSTKSAADAEEISEALDELEIFLHSHNEERLEQIRKLAESLVSENVMADSVQEITQSLTTRFETLNAQATEQQSGLEGRVQEAQAWEREYISVLDYLAQSDLLLTQAIADPTLQVDPVQVQSELAVQQEVLKKMQKQVEVYHSQGKTEAAVRLEDQVTHLLKKYEEIEMKLRLVQKPSDFDERLENVSKQLKDIHEKVHLTSVGSGNPDVIQEQLNQCMSIYQLLSEIKAEVENVIATGRKIVKDGQSTDPDGLTQQLDQLKALYNQLGGAVTEQRGTLERTLRHSRKVQKDAGHLEEWLTTTESELDQREATVPTKCIQAELHFAQHAIDDLGRKKPLLTGLHESYAALTSVCDDSTVLQPVKEQVDDIALTWERVSTRLTNRLKNMQSEQVSKEADMEKFIVGLGEIKGWLESTEHQLGNLSKMEPNDQARLIKAVASEVQNYKSHIENIRDTAVDLINHGTLFQARVQPELVQINQRWENIFKTVQKHKEALPSTTQAFQTVTTSETVFATRSYVKETTKKQPEAGKGDDEGYLTEVSRLAEKIGELRNKTKVTPSYEEALEKAETLEQEVAELEPDIATIISRGDTLTLTTHMVDVHKANVIRTAVNDLRNHWSALKSETEGVKANAEKVNEEVNAVSKKADDIVNWINDVSKRLHLVNNDESQLQALEKEMSKKKEELDDLNNSGALLKKYKYNHIQPILTLLNTRWTEINMQFRQYRKVSLEKKTIVSSSKVEAQVETTNVPDFVASVNRLREAISAISRQLSTNKLAGNHYDNLKGQEDELKSIKRGIETLKPRVDGLEEERNATIKNVSPVQSEQVRRVMDKLREEWAQVNRGYTERHSHWLQCSENWRTLQKTIDEFSVWLTSIEEKVQTTASQSLPEAKITQKELEKQVTLKHRPSQTLQSTCKEITDAINPDEGKRLQERVDSLMKRWRSLLLDLAARREKIAGEEGSKEGSNVEYEALVTWVDQAQALMDAPVNVTDEASLSAHTTMVQNHLIEITTKQNLLKKLKDSKSKTLTPSQITLLETNMSKVVKSLPEYKNMMDTKLGVIKTLVTDVEDLYKWTEEMRVKTALHNLTEEEIKMMKITLHEKEVLYENLDSTYWVLAQDAESKGLTVAVGLKNRMNTIESRLKALQGQVLDASEKGKSTSPSTSPTFSRITPAPARGTEKADEEKVVQEKLKVEVTKEAQPKTPEFRKTEMRPVSTGTTVTSSVTNVIQNVIKFEESVLSTEGDLRPPSPLVCPPKHSSDSSPALILASLDKSILQIRDWLTLMEQMTRQQTVVVGDAENIRQLTEKQKSVLRELEGKKPQLDELVASADSLKDDASRTQLHQKAAEGDAAVYKFPTHSRLFDHLRTCFKVSKLREHWDETNSVVLARKTQLDAMYGDTHKFDAKRSELESWLSRMEARLERMAPVAHTADVLDQQIREQKGFHAEIHQYKHQVELFNQMTQRLIAIYQHDDTRKLKKITETINLRYSSLNSSIIARGKALHSAMNSLHNFDKALDKFASWMSDAESNTDLIELEVDKLGPARRDPQARGPAIRLKLAHYSSYDQLQYKDLQSEIESHKDVLASLNATGQKLLGTLENQDEAVMLQRRLEEMNQRWNTLKHKSIAIRNRLEGNAENWNTLLLSLRELIEWVIRKDTELTALGPLVGDLSSLSKFSEDLAAFRRVIDEKQPVIESNLKSGRQLIASEPPLSDTSDSEAGRELDGDARYRGDDSARDLTRSVRREVAKLSEKWAALRERAAAAAAQADLAHKKLGVLQKTVEEVSGRLDEAQKTADAWGPISQDPNLADQHAHNVRKFREGLAELQRGVDDVNDQAARFSAHNVPLTPANSAKLHDLNNRWKNLETAVNDRWRQVASRSREVTPLTPAQLASSVSPPWERATTSNKVPYYINHDQESTHWDHPIMMDLLDSMNEFNHIKFSAYRTATKLRMLQKKLSLDLAKLQMATDVFDEHGLRGQNDRLIDVGDMVVVLSALYANISADHPEVNTTLAIDLCLNWLLNVYDSQRTGQMRVLSFKIGLVCLCCGHLEEKYRYMFRLIADPNRLVDQRKLGLLLHDCVQVPRQLGEVAAFGGSNIEPSVRSCFTKAGKDRETIEAVHFLAWVQQEPQSLVWLAVLHRVAASENIQHQVKCNICKAYPIVGLRYRCLKCLSFDMCQRCFFDGRSGKSHKITHPMHEYCTATTAGEDVKDFTKALKNKFKSKRSLQKHTKKGYLPVQTVLEGDPLESPSPSPQHNVTSQDMHSRLELYASRLAEVELRTNSNSTPDSEDEHGLIAQYCQSLSSSDAPLPVPRSPLQIMAAVDADQKDELEQMIRALEEENSVLQAEYDRLKSQQTVGSPPDDGLAGQRSEADMLAEAKLLRQHKGRLEARMGILEEHNRQLEAQLHRLRQLLGEPGVSSPNKSGTLQTKSVTASQLAMDSPAKVNGHSTQGGATSAYEGLEQMSEYVRPPPPPMGSVAHVGNLFSRAGDLGKAVGTLVATMTHEGASDLPSDEEEDPNASDTEEEKAV